MSEFRFLSGPVVRALSVVVVLLLGWLCAAPSASAATQTWDTPVFGGYTWVVPDGVTTVGFDLAGSSGGASGGSRGGKGGRTLATIAVTPGESLQINVGGADPAPVNGGGAAGYGYCSNVNTSYFGCFGGNGGGASDVRQGGTELENRVLVAGGGGGAGGTGNDPTISCPSACGVWSGGDGGDAGGLGGFSGSQGVPRPYDPGPGSALAGCGGVGGAQTPSDPPMTSVCWGNRGYSRVGTGGNGGPNSTSGGGNGSGTGGGGGGGYFGGGGGSSGYNYSGGGGGGGGSSFATPAATNVSLFSGVNLGDGKVTVTYGGDVPPVTHTLNVAKAGTGTGSVTSSPAGIDCGSTCARAYDEGASIMLTATPSPGSSFTGWSGACSGSAACTLTMGTDRVVTATFTKDPIVPPLTKPTLSMLSQTNPVFRAGSASTPLTGATSAVRPMWGTVFSFSLDKPATVKAVIERRDNGRRVGSKCKAPTPALRGKPRCTRRDRVAVLTRTSHSGRNSLRFTGRIGAVALKPGKYKAAFSAANGAGRSSVKSLRFKIVKR